MNILSASYKSLIFVMVIVGVFIAPGIGYPHFVFAQTHKMDTAGTFPACENNQDCIDLHTGGTCNISTGDCTYKGAVINGCNPIVSPSSCNQGQTCQVVSGNWMCAAESSRTTTTVANPPCSASNKSCPTGQVCWAEGKQCVYDCRAHGNKCTNPAQTCFQDSGFCQTPAGQYNSTLTTTSCSAQNKTCPSGLVCNVSENSCVTKAASATDCPTGMIYSKENGYCINGCSASNKSCPTGRTCWVEGGYCVYDCRAHGNTCTDPSQTCFQDSGFCQTPAAGTDAGGTNGGTGGTGNGVNAGGTDGGTGGTGVGLTNPLNNINSLPDLLKAILGMVQLLGSIALTFSIVYVGFLFVAARGNEGEIKKAREALMWTVIGGLILLGATALQEGIAATAKAL